MKCTNAIILVGLATGSANIVNQSFAKTLGIEILTEME